MKAYSSFSRCKWLLQMKYAIAVITLTATCTIAGAQQIPVAGLTTTGALQLPLNEPLQTVYLFDMSQFHFETDAEMIKFLSTKSGTHYTIRAQTGSRQGVLFLQVTDHPGWSVAQWNEYLLREAVSQPIKK